MAVLLGAQGVTKSFGSNPLFEGLTFVIQDTERIGLIGPNGAGKSTLLRILAGHSEPDSGHLTSQKGLVVGFLEQSPQLPNLTVEEAVWESARSSQGDDEASVVGEVMSRLELGPWSSMQTSQLSGGWRKRVALARELVKEPGLLLLDEPTNHLDIESIHWLEGFLSRAPFATVTVTHDRYFLRKVANRIVELDRRNPGGLLSVEGGYADYVRRKSELIDVQQNQEQVLRNTLRRETEWLRQGAKARTTKQQARIQAAEVLAQNVEELQARNQQKKARIEFQGLDKQPKRLIEATGISKAVATGVLFQDLDLFIGPKSRVGLLGPNGCGKSTLIRVLLGDVQPDAGKIRRADHLQPAYFEQNRETLNPKHTVREALCQRGDHPPYQGDHVPYGGRLVHIHSYLERFLFRKEQVDMSVSRLSGGEQSRLLLARLMLQPANILVLDEPTNDLDIPTLDVLQECLEEFEGAVLLVTHDRYFLDAVATEILAFASTTSLGPRGRVVAYAGLAQWEAAQKAAASAAKAKPAPDFGGGGSKEKSEAPKRKLGFKEARELAGMEGAIEKAEAKVERLQAESHDPAIASDSVRLTEVYKALSQAQSEVEKLYARWAELEKPGAP